MTSRRRSNTRVQTWAALANLAIDDTEWDKIADRMRVEAPRRVVASNATIQTEIQALGSDVTLPAVTARLQSLHEVGAIDVHYWLTPSGSMQRTIFLLDEPESPGGNH